MVNEEAEKSLLGACLIDRDAVLTAVSIVREEMFHSGRHRLIFAAMLRLFHANKPVDITTVASELGKHLGAAGGYSYLAELGSFVPTAANTEAYALAVKEAYIRRSLIVTAEKIKNLVASGGEIRDVLAKAEGMILGLSNADTRPARPIGDIAFERWGALYESRESGVSGVPTGFRDLDDALGGLQAADLVVLAARPSMGKSALALQIAYNVAARDMKVLVFSLEMSAEQVAERLVCAVASLDSQLVRTRTLTERLWSQGWEATSKIAGLPMWIDDSVAITTLEMRSKAKRLKVKEGLDLVVIDYLQLIGDPPHSTWSRAEHVGEITKRVKALAKECEVPVLLVSQLNRQVEMRQDKRPTLSDLRESGSIEQDADIVMFVYRPEYYKPGDRPGQADVIIGKYRNGPTGQVTLQFEKRFARFASLYKGGDAA